jgi:hypothetical protein
VAAFDPDEAVDDLAAAMHRLSASYELVTQMGNAARARVATEFNACARGREFSRFYTQVLRAPGRRPSSSRTDVRSVVPADASRR